MKNKYLIWIIVLLWIATLGVIFTKHNAITVSGKTITLKTEPVDPRDPFKGDYVSLRYDISTIREPLTDAQKTELLKTRKIYAILKPVEKYFALDHFTTIKPSLGTTYIQGWVWGQLSDFMVVQYNIESYYVPEGKGKEVEAHQGKDLFVEVYVDEKGQASIKTLKLGDKPYIF